MHHTKMKALLVLLNIHVIYVNAICPPGFEEVGSQCYLFAVTPKSWEDVDDYCNGLSHSHNVDLAMMDISVTDNQDFLDAVKTKESAFWIGGKDKGEGYWLWNDGREISSSNGYWYQTEPNVSDGVPGCTMANYTKGDHFDRAYLYSQDCTTQLPYICQAQASCPHEFQRIGMSCYFFSSDNGAPKLTWQSARDFCFTLDVPSGQADLAVLGLDSEIDQEILNIIAAKGERVFLGASNAGGDIWVWVDGRSLPKSSYFWHYNNPNNDGNVLTAFVENNKANIADYYEDTELHFVCKK